jgi:hypothetical protein
MNNNIHGFQDCVVLSREDYDQLNQHLTAQQNKIKKLESQQMGEYQMWLPKQLEFYLDFSSIVCYYTFIPVPAQVLSPGSALLVLFLKHLTSKPTH